MFVEVVDAAGAVVTSTAGRERCLANQPGGGSYTPQLPRPIPTPTTGTGAPATPSATAAIYFNAASTVSGGPPFRVRVAALANGGDLVIATSLSSITSTLDHLVLLELLVTAAALVAALLVGRSLVRLGLRPLREVEATAAAIAAGDLDHRVPHADDRTEVGRVASALNVMLERIESAFSELRASEHRLRRFVGDASHELRTPIAAVSAYAELFRKGAREHPDDLARVLTGIERETSRMARLVDDLLTLAKLDEHHRVERAPVELVGLVAEAAETARTVGAPWPITLVSEGPVEVEGDSDALRRVVDNLLANVRAHTPEGTTVSISVRAVCRDAVIEVADSGPGIAEHDSEAVFERFFRSDPSRSRATGGSGLGLAIVAAIVAAHGGRALARPRPGGGAIIRVRLPLRSSPAQDDS